jgi:hypothetical protein
MASNKCTNWWRITGGRISVPNSLSAIGLWRATRATRWADWKATRLISASSSLEEVDMVAVQRRRRFQTFALLTGVAVIGGYAVQFGLHRGVLYSLGLWDGI